MKHFKLFLVKFRFPGALGERGWHNGESACLPPMWPGLTPGPGVICGLKLLLVLVLASRGFSLGTPVFPFPQKPTHSNSNSILKVSTGSILSLIALTPK